MIKLDSPSPFSFARWILFYFFVFGCHFYKKNDNTDKSFDTPFWRNFFDKIVKNWFLTLFPVTPTEIKLHKRTVCQMKRNFMYFVTYFMQSTRKTNIMSSRTQNMRLKFIASPFTSLKFEKSIFFKMFRYLMVDQGWWWHCNQCGATGRESFNAESFWRSNLLPRQMVSGA